MQAHASLVVSMTAEALLESESQSESESIVLRSEPKGSVKHIALYGTTRRKV